MGCFLSLFIICLNAIDDKKHQEGVSKTKKILFSERNTTSLRFNCLCFIEDKLILMVMQMKFISHF